MTPERWQRAERLARAALGRPPAERADFLAGRALGPYRVEREIRRGGMGEVYLARDTRLDRHVALKLLPHARRRSTYAWKPYTRPYRGV